MIKNLFHNSTLMQEFKKGVLQFSATLFVCLLLFTTMMPSKLSAQVVKPFRQRTSQYSPEQTIYHIQGDFALIGNTNMTLQSYSDDGNNGNNMQYVDIDGDASTVNSSSAELRFSTEHGANPECTNIT